MRIPYDHSEKIKLNQHKAAAGVKQLDASRVALLIVPQQPDKGVWEQVAHAEVLKPRYQRALRKHKDATRLATDLPNDNGTRVILQALDPEASTFELLPLARKLAAQVLDIDPPSLLVQLAGFEQASGTRILEVGCGTGSTMIPAIFIRTGTEKNISASLSRRLSSRFIALNFALC